ncbi:hypothetical protein PAXRUDRAFT_36045 [Paxillus rubicundulus Ve08.2h10]|uniref:Unplaced genomic scaffold scaffold_1076, whole genome shotgun sequence n=1 Tax=Paxillus rubicundulus Ve08.2h10 TaxID=930991 RepID=A0A0D0DHM5_9AGAM|nr:hypothetical protein PAXRUDRAFT_36045 [Paxillus rubicundulus Ve08.2h10]
MCTAKDFLPHIKDHLLGHLLNWQCNGDEIEFSSQEHNKVVLVGNHIYCHKVLRINYTTYNLCRDQDSLNPHMHADVMVLSCKNDATHPYWYAWILGVFHAMVMHTGEHSDSQRMYFLWV